MMRQVLHIALYCLGLGFAPVVAHADIWLCPQPNGTVLYSDRGTSGCRIVVKEKASLNPAPPVVRELSVPPAALQAPTATPAPGSSASSALGEAPRPTKPVQQVIAPPPFPAAVLRVPVLMVNQLSAKPDQTVAYAANPGEVAMADLAVSHVAAGTGPEVSTDSHFGGHLDVSLRTAVAAAAKAVGYDPRFLRVRLSIRTNLFQSGLYIDGPSAGAILAVGVTSALLGDSIRPDVCMSGSISESQEVGPVGGLEEKIKGCQRLNYREMVVPFGQTSMDLALKGMGGDITITEVSTLGAAYQAATGNTLRAISNR